MLNIPECVPKQLVDELEGYQKQIKILIRNYKVSMFVDIMTYYYYVFLYYQVKLCMYLSTYQFFYGFLCTYIKKEFIFSFQILKDRQQNSPEVRNFFDFFFEI